MTVSWFSRITSAAEQRINTLRVMLCSSAYGLFEQQLTAIHMHFVAYLQNNFKNGFFQMAYPNYFFLLVFLASFLSDFPTIPATSRTFRAALLICLNLSGPNWIPPYHRDTTTKTFLHSKISNRWSIRLPAWVSPSSSQSWRKTFPSEKFENRITRSRVNQQCISWF